MKKVRYTGFATDGTTGSRVRVEGEPTFDDASISPRRAHDLAVADLQRRGYRDAHIDDTAVTDS
jgi:hypothetical protein